MNQHTTRLSSHRRRLNLALLAVLLLLMKHRTDKRKRIRQHHNDVEECSSPGTDREDAKCPWRTRDREVRMLREEGRRRLEKWTQEQDGIFERFYGGDGGRARGGGDAYAYAYAVPLGRVPPPSTVAPAVPAGSREVRVEQTLRRRTVPALSRGGEVGLATGRGIRKIRERRVGEARFGIKMRFEMDDACAFGGRVGEGRQGVPGGAVGEVGGTEGGEEVVL